MFISIRKLCKLTKETPKPPVNPENILKFATKDMYVCNHLNNTDITENIPNILLKK
jgi:hypothetical protein